MTTEETIPAIVSITLTAGMNSQVIWWPAEVDVPARIKHPHEVFQWINKTLQDQGTLHVRRLFVEGPKEGKVITGRRHTIIGKSAVATISEYHLPIVGDRQLEEAGV